MGTPSILRKLGDKADRYVSGVKQLPPDDAERQTLEYNQQQVDALAGHPRLAPIVKEEPQGEVINPSAQYGDRGNEKRFVTDEAGNIQQVIMPHVQPQVGLRPIAPMAQHPDMMQQQPVQRQVPQSLHQPMPLYDNGGEVSTSDRELQQMANRDVAPPPPMPAIPQYTGGESNKKPPLTKDPVVDRGLNVMQPAYMPNGERTNGDSRPTLRMDGSVNDNAPAMPVIPVDMNNAPKLYDEGGDVDVNDGKHQMAVLEQGERVLTPEENEQYKKEHPQEAAQHAAPTQTAELRPYGEVKAEKKQTAAPEPSLKTIDSKSSEEGQPVQQQAPPAPEQLPTASHAERVAIKADQQAAMGKGVDGLTQLGMANIHAKQLGLKGASMEDGLKAPAEFNQGSEQGGAAEQGLGMPGAQPAPAAAPTEPAMKPIPTAAAPNTSSEQGGDFKTRLAQLKLDHAKALALRTPEGKVQADYIQEQINDLHKNNPWGTSGNHPGILGKLGHVAAEVGNVAGNIAAPGTMALIPGTELHKREEEKQLQGQTAQDEASLAAQSKADKAAGDAWKLNANVVGPNGRAVLENSKTGETKEAPEGYTAYDKPEHLGDQAQYIAQWYKDHPDAPKSTANDDKALEAYGQAKGAAAQENKAKGKMYYYDTPDGRHGYTYAEAKAAGLDPDANGMQVPAAQAEKDRKVGETYDALKSTLSQYENRIAHAEGQLLPTDVDNMASMIESVEQPDYVSKIVSGVMDDFYGKPVTGYNEKLMKGTLTKKAYDAMSPTARQLVADYFTTLMAHFGNVKAVLGQVPRNATLIQSEMNMIPKPYLNAAEAKPAFDDYNASAEARNAHNIRFGTQRTEQPTQQNNAPVDNDKHKQFVQSITMPDGSHPADAAQGANGATIVWSGKAGDPWIDLKTGQAVK